MRNAIYWALFLGNTSLIPQFYDRRLAFIIISKWLAHSSCECEQIEIHRTHIQTRHTLISNTLQIMLYIQPFSNGNLCLWLEKKKKIHPNTFLIPLSMLPFVGINYSRSLSLHWGINWNFMMIPRVTCFCFISFKNNIWLQGMALLGNERKEKFVTLPMGIHLFCAKILLFCVVFQYCD